MNYISAKDAAQKWNITIRWVQACCKNGLISGAEKISRSWMIPMDAPKPDTKQSIQISLLPGRIIMPLMNSSFAPGKCHDHIEQISDVDARKIARAEFFYFSGQAEKAVQHSEPYLKHPDEALQLSANLIYAFANLTLQRINLSRQALSYIIQTYKPDQLKSEADSVKMFICMAASTLLHIPLQLESDEIEVMIRSLPCGLRQFGCYIIAHRAYLKGDYSRALGIAQAGLTIPEVVYPIPYIYLTMSACMNLMCLKRPDEAKKYFMRAWQMAEPDGLIEAFGEHHGLLQGLIESCLKKDYPVECEKILNITYAFSSGWRKVHNPYTNQTVTDNLTTTEFTIAMLANHGWSNQEIADFLELSNRTVKYYISNIYQKLHITNRKALTQYMLQ